LTILHLDDLASNTARIDKLTLDLVDAATKKTPFETIVKIEFMARDEALCLSLKWEIGCATMTVNAFNRQLPVWLNKAGLYRIGKYYKRGFKFPDLKIAVDTKNPDGTPRTIKILPISLWKYGNPFIGYPANLWPNWHTIKL